MDHASLQTDTPAGAEHRVPTVEAFRGMNGAASPAGNVRHLKPIHLLILLLVVVPPLILTGVLDAGWFSDLRWEDHAAHMLVEGFCGLMSLVVFYILYGQYLFVREARLLVLSHAFLALGILTLAHAASPAGSDLFVWFHATSALAGALLLVLALAIPRYLVVRDHPWLGRLTPVQTWKVIALTLVFGGVVLGFSYGCYVSLIFFPQMVREEKFTVAASIVHLLGALLFFVAAVGFLRQFNREGGIILFILSLSLIGFGIANVIFPLSAPWDLTWWFWHGIKVVIFFAIVWGLAYAFVKAYRDLKQSQQQTLQMMETLEEHSHQIAVQNRELTESQASLVEAEKLASLGRMSVHVAHKIRNPLGALLSAMDLLRTEDLPESEREELLEIVQGELNRLNHMVSDILLYGRSHAVRVREVQLEKMMQECLHGLRQAYPELTVESRVDGEFHPLQVDPEALREAFSNIIENGISAMEARGRLAVALEGGRKGVTVHIVDDGCGIPPGELGNIFEPFFSTKASGSGLGLAIARRIVEGYGGRVEAKSTLGEGTRFVIFLPWKHTPRALGERFETEVMS